MGQGVGEGEFFENFQIFKIELEVQNGAPSLEKLVNDIDLFLAPYCNQVAGRVSTGVSFSIFCPNSPGGAPKLDKTFLAISADFAISSSPP